LRTLSKFEMLLMLIKKSAKKASLPKKNASLSKKNTPLLKKNTSLSQKNPPLSQKNAPLPPENGSDPRLPRYLQVRDDLLQRIALRSWAADEALPSEDKLAAEYEIAVGTMRKVLDALVTDGVVDRVRGRGTFVARAAERSSMLRFVRIHGKAKNQLPTAHIRSMTTTIPPVTVAEKLKLKPRDKALYLHRTRSLDDEIVLSEHIWLPLARFRKLQKYLNSNSPPSLYPVYESECDVLVSRAIDDLTAKPLNRANAAVFKLKTKTVAICVERLMLDHAGEPVEWRTSFVPAERFQYSAEIR
jgi:GntR family transcriptional regulator